MHLFPEQTCLLHIVTQSKHILVLFVRTATFSFLKLWWPTQAWCYLWNWMSVHGSDFLHWSLTLAAHWDPYGSMRCAGSLCSGAVQLWRSRLDWWLCSKQTTKPPFILHIFSLGFSKGSAPRWWEQAMWKAERVLSTPWGRRSFSGCWPREPSQLPCALLKAATVSDIFTQNSLKLGFTIPSQPWRILIIYTSSPWPQKYFVIDVSIKSYLL